MARTVAIVPHTHWDREWYAPFQTLRLRLVDLLDDLLPRLEAEGAGARFLLDGQLAVVDDYLALRPEAEDRLRRLCRAGIVAVGPWYVLPDEFCVSGETLVRDLELGLARAAALGGAMEVGYLPDMFGHVAQMPQLLSSAGFDHAVVWRGVPSAVASTGFWWSSPDGSTVRAEYLPVGYGNGAAVPDDAVRLLGRVRAHEAELGPLLAPGAALLWMNGTDHQAPQPWLGRVVAEADAAQDEYRLVVSSLAEYLATAPTTGLPSWTGELRSGARANVLRGVLSNRVDVKQAAARAERALERRAEPLCALFLPADRWPAAALGLAWLQVVRNAAHDSCCACSADEAVAAVLHRYAEARQIADGLADRALAALGDALGVAGPVAVNGTGRDRSGLVEVLVAGGPPGGAQVVAAHPPATSCTTVTGSRAGDAMARAVNRAVAAGGRLVGIDVVDADGGLELTVRTGAGPAPDSAAADLAEAYARAGAQHQRPVRLRVEHGAMTRALVRAEGVPAFGWRPLPAGPPQAAPVTAGGRSLANGLVAVDVDPGDGTFALRALDGEAAAQGLDRLVDGGDAGDTYTWCPPPADAVVDHPEAVTVEVVETGPLRAALVIARRFRWPHRVEEGRRTGERSVEVATRVELRAGERLVRLTATLDNACRDHRLRSVLPLPRPATASLAECAFAVVERGTDTEGGPHEVAVPTFPSRRFVSAGGLTVVHEGLLEYELVDGGRALALTLLRCVGVLSGTDLATRPQPAGPPLATEAAQMQGRRVLRYGVALGDVDPYALVDDAFLPLEVVDGSGRGSLAGSGSALRVEGGEVSAVRRVAGPTGPLELEVRLFNPTAGECTVSLPGRSGRLVDLRGRALRRFDGAFALPAHGIATVRLDG